MMTKQEKIEKFKELVVDSISRLAQDYVRPKQGAYYRGRSYCQLFKRTKYFGITINVERRKLNLHLWNDQNRGIRLWLETENKIGQVVFGSGAQSLIVKNRHDDSGHVWDVVRQFDIESATDDGLKTAAQLVANDYVKMERWLAEQGMIDLANGVRSESAIRLENEINELIRNAGLAGTDGVVEHVACGKHRSGVMNPGYDALFAVHPKEYRTAFNPNSKAQIVHVPDLMGLKLRVPNYQRPYKWTEASVLTLLDDIAELVGRPCDESEEIEVDAECEINGEAAPGQIASPSERGYRIGSVILQRAGDGCYNIVDGQQRLLTLVLLFVALGLGSKFAHDESFFRGLSQNRESAVNLRRNFRVIASYFVDSELKERFKTALERQIEVVVITVDSESEAFQLFDCQNTRGRRLDPQDLLKAYHLREIAGEETREKKVVEWDRVESECYAASDSVLNISHKNLFSQYLFRILKWSKGEKPGAFTEKDIELFKGVPRGGEVYGYATRAAKAMPCYQIGSDFIAGENFFSMVEVYRHLLRQVIDQLKESEAISRITDGLDDGTKAFSYARQLFYAAVLAYCDRFGKYDELAARKLCAWAFMLRVDLRKVGDKSIVKYAVGGEDPGSRYTNKISMFVKIRQARRHTEISNMVVDFPRPDRVEGNHKELWNELKNLIGA